MAEQGINSGNRNTFHLFYPPEYATVDTQIIQTSSVLKIIRTTMNEVHFLTNIRTLNASGNIPKGTVLATLPTDCIPATNMVLPLGYYRGSNGTYGMTFMIIRTSGTIELGEDVTRPSSNILFYFNGLMYNIQRNIYGGN